MRHSDNSSPQGADEHDTNNSDKYQYDHSPNESSTVDSVKQIGQPQVARLVSVRNNNKIPLPATVTDYKFIQRRRQNRSYRNNQIRLAPNSPNTLIANAEREHAFILEYQNRSKRRNNASVRKKIEFYERELKWLRGVKSGDNAKKNESQNCVNDETDKNNEANPSAVVHLKINHATNSTTDKPEKIIDCDITMTDNGPSSSDVKPDKSGEAESSNEMSTCKDSKEKAATAVSIKFLFFCLLPIDCSAVIIIDREF